MTMIEVENTLVEHMGLADLAVNLPRAVRWQRLVGQLKAQFACDAVVLLQEEDGALRPVAAEGLSREALGRAFEVAQHPRLSTILLSREVVHFEHASTLPDPYDGLVEGSKLFVLHDRDKEYCGNFHGVVVAVGPEYQYGLKPYDKIRFRRHEGVKVEMGGERLLALKSKWVDAVEK